MRRTRRIAMVGVVVALLAPVAALRAIGPTVMMFYGAPLTAPVFIVGNDTAAFGDLHRKSTVQAKDVEGRPFMSVAIFWGPASNPALNGVQVITDLRPDMAWQHGRYYPASEGRPAVFLTTVFTKVRQATPASTSPVGFVGGGVLPAAALAVLRRAGL